MILRLMPVLAAILFAFPMFAQAEEIPGISQFNADSGTICDTDYALCTSAKCTPDPDTPTAKAVCDCAVESGQNCGMRTTCDARAPVDASGTTLLISTYSFAEAPIKDVMTCTGANYWTDCLDAPCVVNPQNPKTAICTCKLISPDDPNYNQAFVAYGGGCDTGTCHVGYWSGARAEDFASGSNA